MQQESTSSCRREGSVLRGARAWVITDGKAGMDVQARGVAEALGLAYEMKRVAPAGLWKVIAPWGPVRPQERFGEPGSLFAPPWPVVAIATGRASIPYMRALRRRAGMATYCVVLQDPQTGSGTADLIWVPQHDRRRGPNVITTPTAPHGFSPARIAELRRTIPPAIAALPYPRVTVALGGKNGIYKFTDADDHRFQASLASIGRAGASFLITASRRTHQRLIRAVDEATKARPRILWNSTGPNPYPFFLAAAHWLVVTADSVNMTGEACATGNPVYVFEPSGGSAKFRRFHEALQRHGATRPLPALVHALEQWSYEPLDSAAIIAEEVERRFSRRLQMLTA
ncbi:MAG TPA: mitochondrial fission ELM1 family protein [Hyphomicrobiaceae bacterium]|nr:mitochondrial fission ELM1 family protein [Hyphomicrobiaceae bacterium]